jgi:hydroxyacylglutathione hydrolase
MRAVEPHELRKPVIENLLLIDTRSPEAFSEGFIKGSVSIPLDANFVSVLDDIVEDSHHVVFVADEANLPELERTMKGTGRGNAEGFLQGGFDAWKNSGHKFDMIIGIDPDEFAMDYQFDEFYLLDTRPKEDFDQEHVEDAENIPLADYEQVLDEMEAADSYYIYSASVAGAVTAASLFKRFGFERVRVIMADYDTLKTANVPFYTAKKKAGNPSNLKSGPAPEN